jgi:hypothetical protein
MNTTSWYRYAHLLRLRAIFEVNDSLVANSDDQMPEAFGDHQPTYLGLPMTPTSTCLVLCILLGLEGKTFRLSQREARKAALRASVSGTTDRGMVFCNINLSINSNSIPNQTFKYNPSPFPMSKLHPVVEKPPSMLQQLDNKPSRGHNNTLMRMCA